ncbi:YgjV family protein [Saccharobesus litoralis]|uniref:YgjV family protein n=2 Tax=Saccharobesus litoralis TaxID=2172099 RepID=A0A2S0VXH0_9ALTE|nr:YgjV family protein [Saccharobesus litoralis]
MVSFALGIASFYQKDDFKLKLLMAAMLIVHSGHFVLLGAYTAASICLVSILRTVLSMYSSSVKVALAVMVLYVASGFITADKLIDWVPVFGGLVGTYSLFCLKGIPLRIGLLIGAMIWVANNLIVGSIGGTLLESIIVIVNSFTIYRLYRDQKNTNLSIQTSPNS